MGEKNSLNERKIQEILRDPFFWFRILVITVLIVIFILVSLVLKDFLLGKSETFSSISMKAFGVLGLIGIVVFTGGMGLLLNNLIKRMAEKLTFWQKLPTLLTIISAGTAIILMWLGSLTWIGWLNLSPRTMGLITIIVASTAIPGVLVSVRQIN